ncbi:protein ACTIVITY OF BC1 COMPLEX KINASE 8, chloroplastic-like isoform X2 [Salvia splendens]|uniref:protein ACTIVITY OF BC1 COMPLEX KINASE 8, chloroplastic-like isoform X2 n=1 Tax=Salvia splendens TaxID=180675 RepID=UPI001C27FB46|nr:protein ACTIVITY OF BC1 COMPLEX KINASE 8, chloroplastic-like isoform X2 [Salvia splendens]
MMYLKDSTLGQLLLQVLESNVVMPKRPGHGLTTRVHVSSWKLAVNDFNGGRLIFYDFGMMGSISRNIREGLPDVFYRVYQKHRKKDLQVMVPMRVLVPTGDMTAMSRTP